MQQAELRRQKEQFVSNLHGTTKWEVFCVVSCLPLCLLIAAYIEAWVVARVRATGKPLIRMLPIPKFVYEFGIVVVPQVLLLMSLAPAEPAFLLLFLLWGSLGLKLWMKLAHSPGSRQHMAHMLQHISTPRKRFVSTFRGGLMLTTCLAILAVDFAAFPRRYAKAEGYGAGVMDVGVGAIVWAGGLVSAAAAATTTAAAAAAGAGAGASTAVGAAAEARLQGPVRSRAAAVSLSVWGARLAKGIRAALPLVVLGGARLVLTAATGYQQHLGEYGLHWNFFWSIAAVNLLTLALPVPPSLLGVVGLAVTLAHQVLLSLDLGLTAAGPVGSWMQAELSGQQRLQLGFWAANKEGLGSLPGYWALHLLGAAVGRQLSVGCAAAVAQGKAYLAAGGGGGSRAAAAVAECARVVWSWAGWLLVADCVVWLALLAAEELEPISRRSCNMPYVLWTTAQCMAWLLLCLMGDLLTSGLTSSGSSMPSSAMSSRLARSSTEPQAAQGAAAAGPATAAGSAAGPQGPAAAAMRHRGLSSSRRRSSSSPAAALAASAAAGAATDATAAAAGSPAAVRSSHDAPPESPGGSSVHSAAAAAAQGSPSSSSSSAGSGKTPPGTPERHRRLQQQQQTHGAHAVAGAAGGSSSSSSYGPMRLMLAFNRNMLALFLLANLLTGAVNLSINTLAVGRWEARLIVGVYMLVLCGLAVRLDSAGVTLKAW